MNNTDPLRFLIPAIVCDAILFFWCWRHWVRSRRNAPDLTFNYRITDIWGTILGTAPAMAYMTMLFDDGDSAAALIFGLFFIPHQLAGVFLWILRGSRNCDPAQSSAFQSFMCAFGGAFAGATILPALSILSAAVILLLISMFPITLPVGIVYGMRYYSRKKKARLQPSGIPSPAPTDAPLT